MLWIGCIVLVCTVAFHLLRNRGAQVGQQQPSPSQISALSQTASPTPVLPKPLASPRYVKALSLGEGAEWRPYPLLVDINEDGHLDIVATHRMPGEQNSLHIWLGTGQGTFNEVPQTWSSPGYSGLAAGDINNDGHLDLVAVSHFHRIYTFLGDGTGRFTESFLETRDGYTAARLGDVNGDGYLDAVVLGSGKTGIEIYLGEGTGKWTLATRLMQGSIGRDVALGDVNGDGKLDIVASLANHGVVVYLQDGTESWSGGPTGFYAANREFRSVALGDINKDGHVDIALNGGFVGLQTPNGPDVYMGDGQGGWTPGSNGLKVLKFPSSGVALGDVDNDGCLDLVAGGNTTGKLGDKAYGLFLFTGDCQGNWTRCSESGLPVEGLMLPYGIALGDLNHDGRLDIVVTHGATQGQGGYLTIWLQQ
jgi:FG-GAP-like repeat